ncbi:MAG: polysulfide reductase NrfD [Deltaproteobacteria bacterium]|nr:polysulfide reductase NrfD [Deltaproteobacteria bacterium]
MEEAKSDLTFEEVDRTILKTLEPPTIAWYILLLTTGSALLIGAFSWRSQIINGIGLSGKNHPISWAVYITDFVFWVGIAHSGTLISAVLFLFRAKWRVPIYRLSEAMTVFAVATAGLFPLIHLGRPWNFYWLLPYPNQRYLWVNFRSPLLWDVFAVSTYLTISVLFFIIGLIPDIAAARDRSTGFRKFLYSVTSVGWRGSDNQWRHYMAAYAFFAAFATPLVLSVHSVVSWDFAMSIVPGWHTTIFPPYFVAGAIFSGLAMVITIGIPTRKIFGLEKILTLWHFEKMAQLIMFTSGIVTLAYATEFFIAWYSQNPFEMSQFYYRAFGELKWFFWGMVFCNCVAPLVLWIRPLRTHLPTLFVLSIFINIGMWLERFNIIVQSLAHEYMPAAWGTYYFTWTELGITLGSFGWFFTLFCVFIKFFPSVSLTEVKETLEMPRRHAEEH